ENRIVSLQQNPGLSAILSCSVNRSRFRDLSNWFNCSNLNESGHVSRKQALVLRKGLAMHELFLLIAIMVATIILMGGMMFLFKGYFNQREKIDREAGR
ncbi:MAG: hypothetical protein O2967_17540, partial [Proteobacteria bacterium]|nr:hypothetical protein [Pseudomonadota bacterium]